MNLDASFNQRTPMRKPEYSDSAQAALPPLPARFLNIPWADMPEKMLVVIDGWSDTPKSLVAQWVAESWGGLVVDSEKCFRSLLTACVRNGRDVNDYPRIESWCEQAAIDIGFAKDGGRAMEAVVAVNGLWLTNADLVNSGIVTNRAAHDLFWRKVRQVLRRCDFDDRVVVVGSDLGFEFPNTPYKFFLDHTGENRDMTELAGIAFPWSGRLQNYYGSPGVTFFERGFKTLFVDANRAGACDIVCVVLLESVLRAHEMGFVGGPTEVLLQHAYFLADAARKRMRVILSEGSSC